MQGDSIQSLSPQVNWILMKATCEATSVMRTENWGDLQQPRTDLCLRIDAAHNDWDDREEQSKQSRTALQFESRLSLKLKRTICRTLQPDARYPICIPENISILANYISVHTCTWYTVLGSYVRNLRVQEGLTSRNRYFPCAICSWATPGTLSDPAASTYAEKTSHRWLPIPVWSIYGMGYTVSHGCRYQIG